MQFNAPPPPVEPPPPPPPPDSAWWTPPLPEHQWAWPAAPLPPPVVAPAPRHRLLIVLSVVVSVAVVAVLAVGFVAAARQVHEPPPDIAPDLSLPPQPTTPPVTDVQPVPSALPAGSVVTSLGWLQKNDGVISVVPINGGVHLTLLQTRQEDRIPIPVHSPMPALRIDATITATTDSDGNEIGIACMTADHLYGARFTINANGDRFMWLYGPDGTSELNEIQSGVIHDVTTANQLSGVCIEHGQQFEMMYAINGAVVADVEVPQLMSAPLYPALYICSCFGHEATDNSAISVSSLPTGAGT